MKDRRTGGWPRSVAFVVFVVAWLASMPAAAAEVAVRGRVLDDAGKPLRGATVELAPLLTHYEATAAAWRGEPEREPVARAVTDDQGAFVVRAPDHGFWKITVAANGFVAAELDLAPLIDEATLADLSMLRDARVTIELAVRAAADDEPGAKPAGKAEIWWVEARATADDNPYSASGSWRARRRVARVDPAAGRVVLPRVEGESLDILAWTPGAPVAQATGRAARVRLAVDRASSPGSSFLLVEDDGTPIANALVCDDELRVPIASTDAAGRALLTPPSAGTERRSEVVVLAADGRVSRVALQSRRVNSGESGAAPTLTATLPKARPITGTVVDDGDSKPIPGAWLWAQGVTGFSSRERWSGLRGDVVMIARSGPAGAFDLRVGEGPRVQATAPDHFASNVVEPFFVGGIGDAAPPGPRIVRLKPWRSVGGVVVDVAGKGIAGALVVPFAGLGQAMQTSRSTTDANGTFRLSGFGSRGASKIVALATGYAPAVESVDVSTKSRDDVRIVLRRGNVVRGRVTDFDDQVVAKALVRFSETRTTQDDFFPPGRSIVASPPLLTASRADGSFEIAGVKSGFYDIVVDAAGYAITVVPGLEIPAGDTDVDLGLVRVGPGVVIEGIVLEGKEAGAEPDGGTGAKDDAAGDGVESLGKTPLAGATIRVKQDPSFARVESAPGPEPWSAWLRTAPMREPLTVESDASGRFTLRDLNPSEKVDLRASLEGYVPALAPGVGGPTEEPVRLVLDRGGTIAGTVVDQEGEAVPQAMVMALDAASVQQAANVDADGKFTLEPLAPGAWIVAAQAPGYERVDDAPLTVEVAAGKVIADLRIVLRELEHGEVDGRVVDKDGVGVSDAWVLVEDAAGRGRTGAMGEFKIERVPVGTRRITAMANRRTATKTIEVKEGGNTVEITLENGVEVSGRVTDREGSAVAGARVSMRDDSGFRMAGTSAFMPPGNATGSTDATGAFRLENVRDGAYLVDATLEGRGRARLPGKLEIRGAPVAGIELVLEKGAVIRGALRGLDIDQLSQVTIFGTSDPDNAPGRVIGEEYEIANLEAGPWRVVGEVSAHGLHAEGRVEVAAGEEVQLDLDFEGGLTVSGTVTRRRQAASGASVVLRGIDVAVTRHATADFEGHFILRGIAEGAYELSAMARRRGGGSPAPWVRRLDVRADTEVAIELGGGSISGLVLDADTGDPLPVAEVKLRYAGPDPMGFHGPDRRVTGAAGEFAYEDVPEGSFSIEAVKEGYASDSARVEVRADSEVDPVVLELPPSEGLRLRVAGPLGLLPFIQVMAFTRNGVPVSAPVGLQPGKTGDVFEVPGIGKGSWSVLVGSGGHGTVWLDVEVPGPVRDVALPRASRIAVEVPELLATSALVLVEVFDAAGRPFPMMAGDRYAMFWPIESGRGAIENLPPGQWTMRAVGAQGKAWSGIAATTLGETAHARLE